MKGGYDFSQAVRGESYRKGPELHRPFILTLSVSELLRPFHFLCSALSAASVESARVLKPKFCGFSPMIAAAKNLGT